MLLGDHNPVYLRHGQPGQPRRESQDMAHQKVQAQISPYTPGSSEGTGLD